MTAEFPKVEFKIKQIKRNNILNHFPKKDHFRLDVP